MLSFIKSLFLFSFIYSSPYIIVYKVFVKTFIGLSSKIAISASLPTSILPILSDTLQISAAFIVIALSTSSIPNPYFAANPAQIGKSCILVTGWSVVIATLIPAFCRTPDVLKSAF